MEEILNKELNNVDETTSQVALTDESNEEVLKHSEVSKTQETSDEIDYKAELDRMRIAKEKAEAKIVKLKSKSTEIDEEAIYERVAQRVQLETQLSALDNEVERVSTSDSEAELIRYHLENSIKSSGNIREDIRMAKLLANEKQILRNNKELGMALKSSHTTSSADYSGQKKAISKEVKLNQAERDLLKAFKV